MKASPLAHLSKWRCLASAVALLVVAFALVAGPVRQALAQNGSQAFAVYCETDKTLTFYKASDRPAAGTTYKGKAATKVFDVDENDTSARRYSPFNEVNELATKVVIAEPEDQGNKLTPKDTSYWFYGFENLVEVDGWENANTSQNTNTSYMYYNTNLSNGLSAPEFDTSSVRDMSYMFYQCTGLRTPDFSHWDVSKVENMDSMFKGARGLTTPNFDGWNPASVKNMSGMFHTCVALESVDFSGWNMPQLTDASAMFSGCVNMTSADVSSWNAPSLTNVQELFMRCSSLTTLDLSSWTVGTIEKAARLAYECSSLTSLDISSLSITENTNYNTLMYIFTDSALEKVTLGEGWRFTDYGSALPNVDGKLWYKADESGAPTGEGYTPTELRNNWDAATMAGTWVLSEPIAEPVVPEAFAIYDSSDKSLTIYKASDKPEVGDTYHFKTVSQVFGINEETEWFSQTPFYSAKDSIEKVIFAEPEDQNNKIAPVSMRKWFDGVSRLKSIEGWENVDGFNLTDMSYLFYGTRLESIDLSALKAPKLETIKSMFGSCLELKTANLSGLVTASMTDASNLFLGCSNLESVDVSKWDTSGMKSMTSVFQRCRDLTEVNLSSWTTTDAVNMKWMFDESGITKVTLGTGFSFGKSPSQTSLPDAAGKLWYKLDAEGNPAGTGYTGDDLAAAWDGAAMAGTWQLTKELEPLTIELAGLTASDSPTYGETLTVTFTPKSGDDVVASGTATLKLGDTVLATVSEPQEDGSFSLSYNTADKGVALGGQTLTVTFESTGYEAAAGTVKTTLSAKALTVEVTSSLDKTWDGTNEVEGLAVELLGALEGDDVTVSATGAYASSNAGEQGVTLTLTLSGDEAAWYTVSAPTDLTGTISAADIVGKLSLSGTPAFGETLTATYEPTSGEQVSYTWTRDGQVIYGATGSAYTLTKEDVGAQIAVVATASDANHTGSVASDAVTVAKAAQDAPVAPVATATSHTTIEVEALAHRRRQDLADRDHVYRPRARDRVHGDRALPGARHA